MTGQEKTNDCGGQLWDWSEHYNMVHTCLDLSYTTLGLVPTLQYASYNFTTLTLVTHNMGLVLRYNFTHNMIYTWCCMAWCPKSCCLIHGVMQYQFMVVHCCVVSYVMVAKHMVCRCVVLRCTIIWYDGIVLHGTVSYGRDVLGRLGLD